jgi:hypothetical protein
MDFIINESQLRKILLESDESRMSDDMKILYSYTKNLITKAKKSYGFNLQLLLTWGASVGGLMMPLDAFIRTGRFDLNDNQQTLILIGIACTYFYDNSKVLKSIIEKIQEEGIEDAFKEVLVKAKNLKSSFVDFIKSLGVTGKGVFDLIAYSFLIPIITDIQDVAMNNTNLDVATGLISERLIASGVVVVSSMVLNSVIKKILERLS